MTKPGIYQHHKGGYYRVLFTATVSTNGVQLAKRPHPRPQVVVYVSLAYGTIHARDETEFNELVCWPDSDEPNEFPRFMYHGEVL